MNIPEGRDWADQLIYTLSGSSVVYGHEVEHVRAAIQWIRRVHCTTLEAYVFWAWVSKERGTEWLELPTAIEDLHSIIQRSLVHLDVASRGPGDAV